MKKLATSALFVVLLFASFKFSSAQDLTISSNTTWQPGTYTYDNVSITNNSTLTFNGAVTLNAANLTIDSGSSISTDGKGYSAGQGPGTGGICAGAGYGGKGGEGNYSLPPGSPGPTYGSALRPQDLGSGGGYPGGASGGGAIRLNINGTLNLNGKITANGNSTNYGGAGSGGSVYITTNALQGSGSISADGGGAGSDGGGGGGGRIAVYYQTSNFTGTAQAKKGTGINRSGEDGTTVFIDTLNNILYTGSSFRFQENDSPFNFAKITLNNSKATAQGNISVTSDNLTLDNSSSLALGGTATSLNLTTLTLNHNSTLTLNESPIITVSNSLSLDNRSSLALTASSSLSVPSITLNNGSILTLSGKESLNVNTIALTNNSSITHIPQGGAYLNLASLSVDSTSSISADGKGYSPEQGPGAGNLGSGAGYGGRGGDSPYWHTPGGFPYGSTVAPVDLGSGGGYPGNASGGGAIRLHVTDNFTFNGKISVNGTSNVVGEYPGGGGSGGSVYIIAKNIDGSGLIYADGGNAGSSGGGGSGGRIAVYYETSTFTGTLQAKGGTKGGEDGTVIFQTPSSDASVTSFTLLEKSSTTSTLSETLQSQSINLTNAVVSGDLTGSLTFTSLEFITIASGSFKDKGFIKGEFSSTLEGITYSATLKGIIYPDPKEAKIYLKGEVEGELNGIFEGELTETTPGSGVFDKLQVAVKLNRLKTETSSATLNLEGTLSYQSAYTFNSDIYLYQGNFEGTAFGSYTGPLSAVLTDLSLSSENEYKGQGFSIISYNSTLGQGQAYSYNQLKTSTLTDFQGLFESPILGKITATLDQAKSPHTFSGTIERLDIGAEPAPELKVQVWGPTRVSPGQTINYIIEYRNDGLKAATDAIVTIELPTFSSYLSGSGGAFYNELAETVIWDLGIVQAKTNGYLNAQVSFPWGLPEGLSSEIPVYINLIEFHSLPDNLVTNGIGLSTKQVAPGVDNPDVIKIKCLASTFDATWVPVYTDMDFFESVPHVFAAMLGIPTEKNGLFILSGNHPKVLGYSGSTTSDVVAIEKGLITTKELHIGSAMLMYQDRLQRLSEKGVEKIIYYSSPKDDLIKKPIRIKYSVGQDIKFTLVENGQEKELAAPLLWWLKNAAKYPEKITQMIKTGEEIFSKYFNKSLKVKTFNIFSDRPGNEVELEMIDEQGNIFPLVLPDGSLLPSHFYIQNDMKTGQPIKSEGIIQVENVNNISHSGWIPYFIAKFLCEKIGQKISEVWKNISSFFKMLITIAKDPNELIVSPPGDIRPGDKLDYTINYENEGEGIAYGVYITDTLEEDLDGSTLTVNNNGTYDSKTRTIKWFIGELASKQQGSVSFSVNVSQTAQNKAEVINFATVYFPSVPEETRTNGTVNRITTATDTTPPQTTAVPSPVANSNGWNNTDVTVTLTAADNEGGSGVSKTEYSLDNAAWNAYTTPFTISTEGTTKVYYKSTDNSGNIESPKSLEVKIDKTPPIITAVTLPQPNSSGWNNTDTTVTFTATDSLSGIASVTSPQTITTEGKDQIIGGEAVDLAGNTTTTSVTLNIDKTPPIITTQTSPQPNVNGWNNTDVTVSFKGEDSLSGIKTVTSPATVSTEGASQLVKGEAIDYADNKATASIILNIDKTPPSLNITATPNTLWPPNHKLTNVTIGGQAQDSLSGIASTSFKLTDEYKTTEPIIPGFNSTIQLEAWRNGDDLDGRTYTITAITKDKADNQATATRTITCPHDMGRK